jgi:hypothetical protein
MIIKNKIKIKVNPNSSKHFNELGYNCINYQEIEIDVMDLPKGSSIKIDVSCDICNLNNSISFNKYLKNTKLNTQIYTCKSCSSIKVKKTKLEKYGDENYQNVDKIKDTKFKRYGNENFTNRDKSKKTCLEKYGFENVSQIEDIKNKKIKTNMENLGVGNPFQSDEIKKKISESVFDKYGSEYYLTSDDCKVKYSEFCNKFGVNHYSKSDEYKMKYSESCLRKWGVRSSLSSPEIRDKIKKTMIFRYGFDHPMKVKQISHLNTKSLIDGRKEYFLGVGYEVLSYDFDKCIYTLKRQECGHVFDTTYDLFRSRLKYNNSGCLECFPKNDLTSIKEKELLNYITELYDGEIITNDRKLLDGLELDIYIPSKKLAFEFNGLYWHSDIFKDKYYHQIKTNKCLENEIDILHIWEDDWVNKKEIIKSIILNRLNLNSKKIFARSCKIVVIDNKKSNTFLNEKHIQGGVNGDICISLEYNNQIVSVMTFGKRYLNKKKQFELIRFCNKIGFNVIGGASKLFNYFLKNYEFENIVSYSDNSLFRGGLYKNLGFVNNGPTSLNYYWTDLNRKYHRFNFNKKRLVKMGYDESKTEETIMKEIGYFKIWSCGQTRWVYSNN